MSYENFVKTKVVTPLAIDTTSFAIEAAVAPNKLPPLDGGLLVLTDSPGNPSFIEVIRYGYRTDLALYEVQRGQEGTTAREWVGPTYCFQSLMAGEFNTMVATLAGKEPAIAAGNSSQYWTGSKTWGDFYGAVRAATLTGLSLASGVAVEAGDNVLGAVGKLQKQISDIVTNLAANVRATVLTGYIVGTDTDVVATDSVLTAVQKLQGQTNVRAPLASPALTGVPTAPTAAVATNTTQVASTAFVVAEIDSRAPSKTGTGASGSWAIAITGAAATLSGLTATISELNFCDGVTSAIQTQLNAKAALASPALTGTPTAPTAVDGTNTTQLATTAFVQGAVGGYLSKAVTGGTVVLTSTEASNPVIGLSGTLTSNLILEIPVASKRIYSISNATTGAFTVTIKVTGLTPTVLVAQGKRNLVYTNGVGAYDAINDFDAIALTGVSTCATAAVGTNTTQIASTAYTVAEIGSRAPTKTGVGASGSWAIAITGNAASATTLGGLTATIAELNFMDGVTSNVQTQLNGKAASSHTHSYLPLAGGTMTGDIIYGTADRDSSPMGTYDSTKTQQIWSMGASYRNSATGVDFGSLYGLAYKHTTNTTGGTMAGGHMVVWAAAGVAKCALGDNIWTSGNVTAYSDRRVKTNIEVIPNALEKVCQLSGYTYDRIDTPEVGRQTGVIAQEVLAVLPEAVSGTEEGHYSVAYGNLVGLLIESIKELKAEVTELRAQVGGV